MARTKKQTLENATERKRQIQEEILKETEAKKSKEELSTHSKEQLSKKDKNFFIFFFLYFHVPLHLSRKSNIPKP